MSGITLVTGNPGKLAEFRTAFPEGVDLSYASHHILEIQGERADPYEILEHKLTTAFELVGGPVIVEDVSAELDYHKGLPGPFVKFYEQRLGDAALWRLVEHAPDKRATIRSLMGYTDGAERIVVDGIVSGTVVAPRGQHGFGFDFVFVPDGHSLTVAEMPKGEKNQVSWRGRAARALAARLFEVST